jgi:hypothetical protein
MYQCAGHVVVSLCQQISHERSNERANTMPMHQAPIAEAVKDGQWTETQMVSLCSLTSSTSLRHELLPSRQQLQASI